MLVNSVDAWELTHFLGNAANYLKQVMGWVGIIVGIAALVWGFIIIAKGLMGGQGQPTPWGKGAALIIFGGILAFGTWKTLYSHVGHGMNKTIIHMGSKDNKGTNKAAPSTILDRVVFPSNK